MPRCQRHHLKRLAAPSHWMLAKSAGKFATKPSTGPHKSRECLPIQVILRDRLKLALRAKEVTKIVKRRLVRVDGKVRTDPRYPTGLMDVVELGEEKIKSSDDKNKSVSYFISYRIVYDAKGRFIPLKISRRESEFKLLRVNRFKIGHKGIPFVVTHDGRTVSCIDPEVRLHHTLKFNLANGEVETTYPFRRGAVAMVTSGSNRGRVGIISHMESGGSINIVRLLDAEEQQFSTRQSNVFVIGEGAPVISLPRSNGVRSSILKNIVEDEV